MLTAYSDFLQTNFFGYGSTSVSGSSSGLDTEYHKNLYSDEDNPNQAACEAAEETSREVANEGIVLFKNGDEQSSFLPLKENSTVTPFGFRYLWPCYSQFGSTTMYGDMGVRGFANLMANTGPRQELAGDHVTTLEEALESNFTINNEIATIIKNNDNNVVMIDAAEGTEACQEGSPQNCTGGNTYLYEFDPAIYETASGSCADSVGLIFIGRDAGEGNDLKKDAYEDGTEHQLQISSLEKETIKFAKENCSGGTVAVINSNNALELEPLLSGEYEVDAIVWVGTPGSAGFQSFSDILCGKVNPSGHSVTSWIVDETLDPTYANMSAGAYSNVQCHNSSEDSSLINTPYVEYEEGIYVDYKYYETADEVDSDFVYEDQVIYPFGYGLSYCDIDGGFDQEITSIVEENDEVTVEVNVTNNSQTYSGKDAVELYYSAPYTSFDIEYGIEKASVNLLDFEKTVELAPGESTSVTFEFNLDELTSYSNKRENPDGTKGAYVLEEGDYTLSVRSDSHNVFDSKTLTVDETEWFDSTNPRQSEIDGQSELDDEGNPTGVRGDGSDFQAASNQFDDMSDYMDENTVQLSRADWKNTQPTKAEASKEAPADVVSDIQTYSYGYYDQNTDTRLGNVEGSLVYNDTEPTSNAGNDIEFVDMRGVNYHDEKWDLLLDNLDYDSSTAQTELSNLFYSGTYNVSTVSSIAFDANASIMEGPAGIGAFSRTSLSTSTVVCTYPSGMMQASTWNKDLAYDVGAATAQEFMNVKSDSIVNGWAGPSMNSQRSHFSGRNGEYYSVDPVLSGNIGCNVIEGASDGGLFCIFKHLAMNDLEDDRHSICVWANEQTVREQYIKTFEIVMKEGRKTINYVDEETGTVKTKIMKASMSAMTTMTRMGAIPTGGHYNLLTNVVRGEWGFEGLLMTDMPTQTDSDLLLRAGSDIQLVTAALPADDMSSNTAKNLMRESVHHIMYAVVNSNYMNGKEPGSVVTQGMSGLTVFRIVFSIVLSLLIAGLVIWTALRIVDAKKHPDKYKTSKKKE